MQALDKVFNDITDKYQGYKFGNIPNLDMVDRITLIRAIRDHFNGVADQKIVNYALSNNITVKWAYYIFNSDTPTIWQCQLVNVLYDDLHELIADEFRDYLSREDFRENASLDDYEAPWHSSNDSEFAQEKLLDDRDRARDMKSTGQAYYQ